MHKNVYIHIYLVARNLNMTKLLLSGSNTQSCTCEVPAPSICLCDISCRNTNGFCDFFFLARQLDAFLVSFSVRTPLNTYRQVDRVNNYSPKAPFCTSAPISDGGSQGGTICCSGARWSFCAAGRDAWEIWLPCKGSGDTYRQLWGCLWKESCWKSKWGSYLQ